MFKSDRCGIETYLKGRGNAGSGTFKSDRCGIETQDVIDSEERDVLFKSDRCGIETLIGDCVCVLLFHCSNQTVAGLKHPYSSCILKTLCCSNQTVAGLKHYRTIKKLDQQLRSNQTVAGLKPFIVIHALMGGLMVQIRPLRDWNPILYALPYMHIHGSNQTVAGLKLSI